jgi:hypothetical protein
LVGIIYKANFNIVSIEKKFELSIIKPRDLDYSKAEVYDSAHKNPFEYSMKVVKKYPDLPKLKFVPGASSLRSPSWN